MGHDFVFGLARDREIGPVSGRGLGAATTAQSNNLAHDAKGNLFRGRRSNVKTRRRANSRELLSRDTFCRKIVKHKRCSNLGPQAIREAIEDWRSRNPEQQQG